MVSLARGIPIRTRRFILTSIGTDSFLSKSLARKAPENLSQASSVVARPATSRKSPLHGSPPAHRSPLRPHRTLVVSWMRCVSMVMSFSRLYLRLED